MLIKYIVALDAFSHGGYIDLKHMSYIPPKWIKDEQNIYFDNNDNYSYDIIDSDLVNYIKAPMIRLTGISARAGLNIGISRQELVKVGMTKTEYWDVFYPNISGITEKCSEDEWKIVKKISDISRSNGHYLWLCEAKRRITRTVIEDWLKHFDVNIDNS